MIFSTPTKRIFIGCCELCLAASLKHVFNFYFGHFCLRLKESGCINMSLFQLGKVVDALNQGLVSIDHQSHCLAYCIIIFSLQNEIGHSDSNGFLCTAVYANEPLLSILSTVLHYCNHDVTVLLLLIPSFQFSISIHYMYERYCHASWRF